MNNHEIALAQAIEMTATYRAARPENFPLSETFTKEAVLALLSVGDAAYLRIYYGTKTDGTVHAILVAADQDQHDILPGSAGSGMSAPPAVAGPLILEDGFRCPPYCPPPSPLNS